MKEFRSRNGEPDHSRQSHRDKEQIYWTAVESRDARFDGAFVFGVRSTGIYCRPSCPARRPRQEQVVFFGSPDGAEQTGFRPCRRCHPKDRRNRQLEFVERACRYIESQPDTPLTLKALGARLGVSPYHLHRTFKRLMGITPHQYREACRLDQFKAGVKRRESVLEAMFEAGYGSTSRLYERAAGELGMTPATYRRGGGGMNIRYAIVECGLGHLLAAATDRGICAVRLGDAEVELEKTLANEFPAAEIQRDEAGLSELVSLVLAYMNGQHPRNDLPLDIQATAFKWRVWRELRTIPRGQTRSYSEVARAIGKPKAVRAVARACAANPVAVIIPCHRVIRKDGSLGGYRWGLERKQAVLEQEMAVESSPAGSGDQV